MSRAANQAAIREWIRAALAHAGMTQAQLGRKVWAGDRSVPNKVLRERRDVRIEELDAIQQATGYRPFVTTDPVDTRPLRPPPDRAKRTWHIKEWRIHTEFAPEAIAKAMGIDKATYSFLEEHPHKFTFEQAGAAVKKMKINFDDLWFDPTPKKFESQEIVQPKRARR